MTNLVRIIFYGNIFYGLIAVALCIETNLVHGLTINHFPFYLLIFFGSWIYYTMIYVRSSAANADKEINHWYRSNLQNIKRVLFAILLLEAALVVYLVIFHFQKLQHVSILQWALMASVPVAGALYTFNLPLPFVRKFRQVGWLKPIVIGVTWAGWVTIYPIVVWQVQYALPGEIILPDPLFWFQNFFFITTLAIIFDVKDVRTDVRRELKTYPAQFGVKATYRWIIFPATLITIAVAYAFQIRQAFTFAQIIIQQIPLLLLLMIALRPRKEHNILYYLVYIDGLMLLKAIAGIVSVQLF